MAEFEFPAEVNNSLRRSRRHASFVNLWNGSLCYYPEALHPNSSVMCRFVTDSPSCTYYIYYFDYLKFLFCTLKLPWNSGYIFIVGLMLMFLYGLLYMIFKYFCIPSFLALMELLPVSQFAYSFLYFGFCIFMPDYVSLFFDCTFKNSVTASLQYAKNIGDILHYFIVGVMAICINGYRVNAILLWSTMSFMLLGYVYMMWVVHTKYELFGRRDLVNDDTHTHFMNAWSFLFAFVFVMFLVLLISYYTLRRVNKQISSSSALGNSESSDIPSDADISGKSVRISNMTRTRIWWKTVNGFDNLKEPNKIIVAILFPFYFVLANMIPVIDMNRPLRGWCKPVAIISLLMFPIMSISLKSKTHTLYVVFACSWFLAFVTCISTDSLREPSYIWLRIYSMIGMITYSISMHAVIGEIDNLLWQFMSMRFHPMPDMIVILFISTGELFCMLLLLGSLIRRKLLDAAYGAVMSVVVHSTYMALPQLVLQECYNPNIYILCTSKAYTCNVFFIVIFIGTLFHVTMSGNEFRMSLFFYLVAMYSSYLLYQMLTYYSWIHPLGEAHNIRPPSDPHNVWA